LKLSFNLLFEGLRSLLLGVLLLPFGLTHWSLRVRSCFTLWWHLYLSKRIRIKSQTS
jgi:hypothetical protein